MASSRPYRRLLPDDTRDYLEQAILPDLRHALVTANEVRPPNVIGFVAAGLTGRKPDGWRRPDEEPQTDVDAAFAAHFGTGAEEDGWYDPAARGALKSALLTVALESRVAEPLVNIGSRLEDSADDYAHLAPDASVQPPAPKPRAAVAAPRLGALRKPAGYGSPANLLRADEGATITVKYQRPDGRWAEAPVPWEEWHGAAKRQFAVRRAVALSPTGGFELARAQDPADPLGGAIADCLGRGKIRAGETVWLRATTTQRSLAQMQEERARGARGGARGRAGGRSSRQISTLDRLLAKKKRVEQKPRGAAGAAAAGGANKPGVTMKLTAAQEKATRVAMAKAKAKSRRSKTEAGSRTTAKKKVKELRKRSKSEPGMSVDDKKAGGGKGKSTGKRRSKSFKGK
jgi:hypothetical protein